MDARQILTCRAESLYDEFTVSGPVRLPQSLETLVWLKEEGLKLGLATNCAPDVPRLGSQTEFADLFDHYSYSCIIGSVKPDAAIYRDGLDGLGVDPRHVLYVGDGWDQELTGAQAVGNEAGARAPASLHNHDSLRKDVDNWEGRVIGSTEEIRSLIVLASMP